MNVASKSHFLEAGNYEYVVKHCADRPDRKQREDDHQQSCPFLKVTEKCANQRSGGEDKLITCENLKYGTRRAASGLTVVAKRVENRWCEGENRRQTSQPKCGGDNDDGDGKVSHQMEL